MTHLDPDPLYIGAPDALPICGDRSMFPYSDAEGFGYRDWQCIRAPGHKGRHAGFDPDLAGWDARPYLTDRPSPSLTVPLVLLCAVLTVLVAVWWVKG